MNADAETDLKPLLSVIIPARNESETIAACISGLLREEGRFEIIVVDGESDDGTIQAAARFPTVRIISSSPGRARQMNAGARIAYGDILLFLHADTSLESGWYNEVVRFNASPHCSAGTFLLRFAHGLLRYRALAWLVNKRTQWLSFPYGDQGMLVRKSLFRRLTGFLDMPLLEDADLFRRLRKHGKLFLAERHAVTSTRKWTRDGFAQRTLRNLAILLLYKAGVSTTRLSSLYRSGDPVLCIFSKFPSFGSSKTRLAQGVGEVAAAEVHKALLVYTWGAAKGTGHDVYLYHPREHYAYLFQQLLGLEPRCRAQASGDLGHRLACAFRDLISSGRSAVIVGSDCPRITRVVLAEAMRALQHHDAVIGRTRDGGFYLIGLRRLAPGLFDHIAWSTDTTGDIMLKRLKSFGYRVHYLADLYDIDTRDDLAFAVNDDQLDASLRSALSRHIA